MLRFTLSLSFLCPVVTLLCIDGLKLRTIYPCRLLTNTRKTSRLTTCNQSRAPPVLRRFFERGAEDSGHC